MAGNFEKAVPLFSWVYNRSSLSNVSLNPLASILEIATMRNDYDLFARALSVLYHHYAIPRGDNTLGLWHILRAWWTVTFEVWRFDQSLVFYLVCERGEGGCAADCTKKPLPGSDVFLCSSAQSHNFLLFLYPPHFGVVFHAQIELNLGIAAAGETMAAGGPRESTSGSVASGDGEAGAGVGSGAGVAAASPSPGDRLLGDEEMGMGGGWDRRGRSVLRSRSVAVAVDAAAKRHTCLVNPDALHIVRVDLEKATQIYMDKGSNLRIFALLKVRWRMFCEKWGGGFVAEHGDCFPVVFFNIR